MYQLHKEVSLLKKQIKPQHNPKKYLSNYKGNSVCLQSSAGFAWVVAGPYPSPEGCEEAAEQPHFTLENEAELQWCGISLGKQQQQQPQARPLPAPAAGQRRCL